ncbi:MAG: TetR/AcrR family transcriptional regulator [Actinomycetota bacterium]
MDTERTEGRWRRPGTQARSQTTQDAFLDAAERLFAREGVAATAVTEVAAEAGRSIGSLYHHFDNKETLVGAVVDRVLARLEAGVDLGLDPTLVDGRSISDLVAAYVRASLRSEADRPGAKRTVVEVALSDDETRRRYAAMRRRLDDGLVALFLDRRDEIGHPDPETACRFAVDQLTGMLAARLDPMRMPTQLERADDDAFVAEARASVSAYLQLD